MFLIIFCLIFGLNFVLTDNKEEKTEVEPRISLNTLCDKIDESVQLSDKRLYFFSGQYFWEVDKKFNFLKSPTYVQNKWGFLIKTPLDAVFTFNRGRFQNKTIFIKGKQWWRMTADGLTEASNTIAWKGWPEDRTVDTAFVFNYGLNSKTDSLVFFLFGSKYSVYRFGADEKAMIGPTPVVVMADAMVNDSDNELLFLKIVNKSDSNYKTVDSLMTVTASMNVFEDNYLYLFAKNNKFCKINANDKKFVCNVTKVNDLLKCEESLQLSKVPEHESEGTPPPPTEPEPLIAAKPTNNCCYSLTPTQLSFVLLFLFVSKYCFS